jgi:phosphatidylserine/phosphatidylglycerophosphate/cardiolipin synthase-like enzyme
MNDEMKVCVWFSSNRQSSIVDRQFLDSELTTLMGRKTSFTRRIFGYLVILVLACVAFYTSRYAGKKPARPSRPDPATSVAARVARDAGPGITGAAITPGAIHVYFSDTYANDPSVPRNDPDNIDRHLASFMAAAKSTLDCAFFELESDRLASALIAAQKRGVRVRIVGDSDYRDNPQMQSVIAAGIPVVFDERSALMHNKFVVADRASVWTGSFNATDNCAFRNNNNAISIQSRELAENYSTEFAEMFEHKRFGPSSPAATPHPDVTAGGVEIHNYFSPEDDVPPKIVRFLRGAHTSIHFMAFSFTDATIGQSLVEASRRGVKVEGVMERRGSDTKDAQLAPLVAAGIPVLKDGNTYVMHHKVIVIDGLWTITGSYNFTGSGAHANDENLLVIKSRDVAKRFEDEYARVKRMAQGAM